MWNNMIHFQFGNIFDSSAQALVNPINCVGVMGKGLALQFKQKYPEMFEAYKEACRKKWIKIGNLFLFTEKDKLIIGFPTKKHWKDKSELKYIEIGLIKLVELIKERNIKSIAIPALGCGLGQLKWDDVRDLMIKYLEPLNDVEIFVYLPQ